MAIICLNNEVSYEELKTIKPPHETETYVPINHAEFVDTILERAEVVLPKRFKLDSVRHGIESAKMPIPNTTDKITVEGARLFGFAQFKDMDAKTDETRLSLGFRSSYDRTLRLALACGLNVNICNNGMLTGDVLSMRKHTKGVKDDLISVIDHALTNAPQVYNKINEDIQVLKDMPCDLITGFSLLGVLNGMNVLTPSQTTKAQKELLKPSYSHEQGSLWFVYNACTEALKKCPIADAMARRLALHKCFLDYFTNNTSNAKLLDEKFAGHCGIGLDAWKYRGVKIEA